MKIVLMKNIYDRIVSIRSNTNVFLQRKPGRTKRPGFFMCPYPLKGYIKLLGQVLLKGFNSPSEVGAKQRKVYDEIFIGNDNHPVFVQLAG